MSVVTYEGTVENGQIRLPAGIDLPERTRVFVVVPAATPSPNRIVSPRLRHPEQLAQFHMEVSEVSDDVHLG